MPSSTPPATGPKGSCSRSPTRTGINIATFAAFEPDPLFPTSGAFRAALAGFTRLYADEHAAAGIRMNNVLPGFIDDLSPSEGRRGRVPMKRCGCSAEVASLIAWLASEEGGRMTGQNLRIGAPPV